MPKGLQTVIHVDGRDFPTISALADHYSLCRVKVGFRLRKGWTPEQAVNLAAPPERRRDGMAKAVVYEGVTFPSMIALANHLGETEHAIRSRVANRGLSLGDLDRDNLRPGLRPGGKWGFSREVTIDDKTYPSVTAFSAAFGLPFSRVAQRLLRLGWTPRQAVELDPPPPRPPNTPAPWRVSEIIDGHRVPKGCLGQYKLYEITNTVNDTAYVGITINGLEKRLKEHAGLPEKIASPLSRAIRKYGLDKFRIRLLRRDATNFVELQEQEIAEIARRQAAGDRLYNVSVGGRYGRSTKWIKVGELWFPSAGAAAAHYEISPAAFAQRLTRLGWTPEQAAEIEPSPSKYARKTVTVMGVTYKSASSAATALGLPPKRVLKRLANGWSIEHTFELTPVPWSMRPRGLNGLRKS